MAHKIKDYEKGLVAACLQNEKLVDRAIRARIKPGHFKDRDCAIIFEIITSLHKQGAEVNGKSVGMSVNLNTEIEDRHRDVIKSKVGAYSKDEVDITEFSFQVMVEKRRVMDMTRSMGEIVDKIYEGQATADELEKEISRMMKVISDKGSEMDLAEYNTVESWRDRVEDRRQTRQAMEEGGSGYLKLAGYLTVFEDYFQLGFPPQTITGVAGMTGVGKSHMMNAFAYMSILPENACNVLYLISENRRIETESRLDAIMLGEDINELFTDDPPESKEKIFKRQRKKGWGRLFTCKVTVNKFDRTTIEAAMEFIEDQYQAKINVLIIDSPDHMISANVNDRSNGWEKKSAVYDDIKGLADEYCMPVITSVPMQASTEGKADVSSANVAGSYNISKMVDNLIMFLHSPQDDLLNRRRLKVTKLRGAPLDGRIISLRLKSDLTYTEWKELDESTDEPIEDSRNFVSKFKKAGYGVEYERDDEEEYA